MRGDDRGALYAGFGDSSVNRHRDSGRGGFGTVVVVTGEGKWKNNHYNFKEKQKNKRTKQKKRHVAYGHGKTHYENVICYRDELRVKKFIPI